MGSPIKLYWVYAVFAFVFVMVNLGLTINYFFGYLNKGLASSFSVIWST